MSIRVELPPELEQKLLQHCMQEGRSIDDVMADAIAAWLASTKTSEKSAFELGAGLFGRYAGPVDLAEQRQRYADDIWAEKPPRHRSH